MGEQLVAQGRRIWSVGVVLLFGAAACATPGVESDKAASDVSPAEERTQQVVQRVLPARGTETQSAGTAANGRLTPASSSREGRSARRADAISSKHLEAELNRLEAELGR